MSDLTAQAKKILLAHPFVGRNVKPMVKVLEACGERALEGGETLCAEADPSGEMWFLLNGGVRVLKKGPRGEEKELAVIQAPALIGHMGLIDGSSRSATCQAVTASSVAVLDQRSYKRILGEPTTRGTALRRLLISSLTSQLVEGNRRLQGLLDRAMDATPSTAGGAITDDDLLKTAGVLSGWKISAAGVDDVSWVETEDAKRNRKNPIRR